MIPDIIIRDDMIINLVCYQWLRRYDKADLSWYEISWYLSAHSAAYNYLFICFICWLLISTGSHVSYEWSWYMVPSTWCVIRWLLITKGPCVSNEWSYLILIVKTPVFHDYKRLTLNSCAHEASAMCTCPCDHLIK